MTTWGSAVIVLLLSSASYLSAQPLTRLGMSTTGHSFEYVARADQSGDSVTLYGYMTHVHGIDDGLLFASVSSNQPPQGEANARLSFVSKLTFTSRIVNGTIISSTQDEELSVYFTEFPQGRDFTKSDSFSGDTTIATFKSRVHNVLNVQAPISATGPGRGITQVTSESLQDSAVAFTLDNNRYVFGQVGRLMKVFGTGQGVLTGVNPFVANFLVAGYAEGVVLPLALPRRRL
jgi:hypothetical protein